MIRILAYGNPLRQDDGVGPLLAEKLGGRFGPGVEVRTAHQLQVEWLEDLRPGDLVLFIDASRQGPEVGWQVLEPEEAPASSSSHHLSPGHFCRMARELYHLEIQAHLCTVQGEQFDLGQKMTREARERVEKALEKVTAFLEGKGCGCRSGNPPDNSAG